MASCWTQERGAGVPVTTDWCSDPAQAVELEGPHMAGVGLKSALGHIRWCFYSLGYRFIFLTTAVTNSARLMEAMSEVKA